MARGAHNGDMKNVRPNHVQVRILGDLVRLAAGLVRNEHGLWRTTATADGSALSVAGTKDADIHGASVAMHAMVKNGLLVLKRETRGEKSAFDGRVLAWCGHYRVREDLAVPTATTPEEAGALMVRAEANRRERGPEATTRMILDLYAAYRLAGGKSTVAQFAHIEADTDEAARLLAEEYGDKTTIRALADARRKQFATART